MSNFLFQDHLRRKKYVRLYRRRRLYGEVLGKGQIAKYSVYRLWSQRLSSFFIRHGKKRQLEPLAEKLFEELEQKLRKRSIRWICPVRESNLKTDFILQNLRRHLWFERKEMTTETNRVQRLRQERGYAPVRMFSRKNKRKANQKNKKKPLTKRQRSVTKAKARAAKSVFAEASIEKAEAAKDRAAMQVFLNFLRRQRRRRINLKQLAWRWLGLKRQRRRRINLKQLQLTSQSASLWKSAFWNKIIKTARKMIRWYLRQAPRRARKARIEYQERLWKKYAKACYVKRQNKQFSSKLKVGSDAELKKNEPFSSKTPAGPVKKPSPTAKLFGVHSAAKFNASGKNSEKEEPQRPRKLRRREIRALARGEVLETVDKPLIVRYHSKQRLICALPLLNSVHFYGQWRYRQPNILSWKRRAKYKAFDPKNRKAHTSWRRHWKRLNFHRLKSKIPLENALRLFTASQFRRRLKRKHREHTTTPRIRYRIEQVRVTDEDGTESRYLLVDRRYGPVSQRRLMEDYFRLMTPDYRLISIQAGRNKYLRYLRYVTKLEAPRWERENVIFRWLREDTLKNEDYNQLIRNTQLKPDPKPRPRLRPRRSNRLLHPFTRRLQAEFHDFVDLSEETLQRYNAYNDQVRVRRATSHYRWQVSYNRIFGEDLLNLNASTPK